MAHFVYIPFRGVGIDLRDDVWFAQRIEIFKKYTLNSLLNQTCKDFVLWVSFRPQDRENPLVKQLDQDITIPHVFTFDGLMYHDDKFGGNLYQRAKNIGRIVRWCYTTGNWSQLFLSLKEIVKDKNKTLEERIGRSLKTLIPIITRRQSVNADPGFNPEQESTVLLTRIDSDDMFRKDVIEQVQKSVTPRYDALSLQFGYIYNTETGEVAEWNPKTNPPFHTIIFRNGSFWHAASHLAAYKGFKSHEDIPNVLNTLTKSNGRAYCVTTSNPKLHISTNWNHPFRAKLVDKQVLKDFGI